MIKLFFTQFLIFLIGIITSLAQVTAPSQYVNPFTGTDGHGHTYPGATLPFGMVQLSPATRLSGWDGCSGYHYTDSILYGFTHTALNGTGVSDYGDILLMPLMGEPVFSNHLYASTFKKMNEHAEAGYYRVLLDDFKIKAELTTTVRTGYHRYTFPETREANIIIDLKHRDQVTESWIEIINDREIRGMRRSSNWAKDMQVYFHMIFSKPFLRQGIFSDNELQEKLQKARGTNIKAFVGFETKANEPIEVKVGISFVSAEGAYRNIQEENPDWNFNTIREEAWKTWNKQLSRITIISDDENRLKTFYTALYHTYLQPNTAMDVDGKYRGIDKKIHQTSGHTHYTVFSLWDTYRTWHPLMTLLETERTGDFIKVFLNIYEQGGLLPVWELAANETFCMIGYHSVSVIADAWLKGIRNYDGEKALKAMQNSAMQDHFGLEAYRRHGHIPGDMEHESVSKTLEYAYDDWCIAQMAKDMGKDSIYRTYIQRAQFYQNIFDPSTGFMRPKINGRWNTSFDPTRVDWHFTEANSWQYSFYVPQDISGLINLHGGKENFAQKIDELFETTNPISGRDQKDITGMIGQYAHGNEPSHHMAYLYNYVNKPWKTQQRVRQIMDNLYSHQPDGLSGNEDCGQMSAWLVMSAMGFYPVTPGSNTYVFGTPWFPETTIHLENGNHFKITAENVSSRNFYIQSAELNGRPYPYSYLKHDSIITGGHLHFTMGSAPNKNWASEDPYVPVARITDEPIVPVPVITSSTQRFKKPVKVSIQTIHKNCEIYYTLDGSQPGKKSISYSKPFFIDKTQEVNAVAWDSSGGYSFPVKANFIKLDFDKNIEILTNYNSSYHAGGPEGLIDGIRGPVNWRLGGWQGYQDTDFEAIIDLGQIKSVQRIAAGFLQDTRSWILMPKKVEFWISEDAKHFKRIATVEHSIADKNMDIIIQDLGVNVETDTRYLKIIATNYGELPPWHPGAGSPAFIFIDEVMIE
ncbi:MAG: GH92 family glycosyl hydrolase [Bacteroidales bacterium]|jgi:predicted alpha-1,2-mannosidase|nr:GH92 family glycosyl hydrolase [Bacteroidales bacterium]